MSKTPRMDKAWEEHPAFCYTEGQKLELELSASTAALAAVSKAAQAVIDRWETPMWKDAPATAGVIYALRDAITSNPNHP